MGEHVEDILFAIFDGIDEKELQQEKVQMEKHIQDVAPHQHPNDVGIM